jgi:hypothetical protein
MWFLTGIVMIYHRFPSASRDEKLAKMEPLAGGMPALDSIASREGLSLDSVNRASVYRYMGQTFYELGSGMNSSVVLADSSEYRQLSDSEHVMAVAALWCQGPMEKIDTLYSLEQWIPFGRLKEDFPIYKFHFADADKTQLYISSKSKEALQCTSRSERIWAWLGAIPHWVYFTWLRQDVETWKEVIIWLSIFGIIMLISGFWLAIRSFRISRKAGNGLRSPYKKKWYRWHHVFGTIFGLFLFTWILSGMYSLTEIPQWLGKEHQKYDFRRAFDTGLLKPETYVLGTDKLLEHFNGQATKIEWKSFAGIPYYQVQLATDESVCIDASDNTAKTLDLTSDQILKVLEDIHKGEAVKISQMTEYDSYYLDLKGKLELPVWKAEVDNPDKTCYYINPHNGFVRSQNTHSRWGFQLYQGFHSLRYKVFLGKSGLWTVVMWFLLLGGAFVSLTGVVLGIKYIIRLFKRKKRLDHQ